jgi:hypothetical protein
MERSAWTDERLDDRFDQIDRRFDRVDGEIADLRSEIREGFASMRSELGAQRSELSGQIEALRLTMLRVGGGMMVGLVGVIAAILARGV